MKPYDRVSGPSGFPVYLRQMALVLAVLILLVLLIAVARAEPQTMYVSTQTDPLNVRESPSIHADKVYWLDRGDPVTVYDTRGGWAYVERCGDYGWCRAEYLADMPPVDKLPEGWLDVEPD